MTEPTDAEIRGLAATGNGVYQDDETAIWEITDPSLLKFARAIEAEVRKQDDALIQQMLEALTLTERYLEIEVGAAYGRDAHISKIKEYESRLKKHKKCITAALRRAARPQRRPGQYP